MPKLKPDTFDPRPLIPAVINHDAWVADDRRASRLRLANRASVEEISGSVDPKSQRWRWRICKFGGETGIAESREKACRQAEFLLGLGELRVVLAGTPATAQKKGGG